MVFKINNPFESERKISQSVIQVIELLGMYNAELARILGQQCGDIGELTSGQHCIRHGSQAWSQAVLFIETYHLLFDYFDGDSVAMYHWMRADNKHLKGTPHFLIVDEGKLQLIHDYLHRANLAKTIT
ncbi:MAG: hypothetical protein BMS9Abin19_0857 [Gammaproteobacteria bacterium]|nr:MAG: hypothetical protein BMS9Abin19_0857 [Gammaproteobacteria bacterium]